MSTNVVSVDATLQLKTPKTGPTRRNAVHTLLTAGALGLCGFSPPAGAGPARPWLTLPETPKLPPARDQGVVRLNGTPVFFAQFGDGPHVLLLHGGSANSHYWGHQVRELAKRFLVTVMDTRGHGRSAVTSDRFSYAQFASDVVVLLKHRGIPKCVVVGWSDGAITGFQLALTRPELMSGLFAFGANTNLQGLKAGGASARTFRIYGERCRQEYLTLSPHPDRWPRLQSGLVAMWRSQPTYTSAQLSRINLPTMVVGGRHDEIIRPEHTSKIAAEVPRARLAMMEQASHFAFLQDPPGFNAHLLQFLSDVAR